MNTDVIHTVWCMHPVMNDISAATRWGVIRYINQSYVYEDQLDARGVMPLDVMEHLNAAANEFDADHDCVLIGAGDHLQLAQFIYFLANKGKSPNVLRWDRKAEGYFPALLLPVSTPVTLTRRTNRV